MKIKHLLAAALLLLSGSVAAQEMPSVPVDKAVRIGKLDNGLTYYIRHNDYPEHVASFYIAQKVGSINENDDQQGLAHLLEHLAFNGSDHFKGNDMQEYLQSIGVHYGRNLNAYTSTDQTVYYITDVPTQRISAVDSCMLILKDWSNGILLTQDAIDNERDIVHNEYRMRIVGMQKVLESALPSLYPGSKYGHRFPIGKMEIIDGCDPETLRAYYRKWYRPDNQGIIIVGDIDVDRTEAKIKELFSGIQVPADAAQVVPEQVPDNNEAIYYIGHDKEQTVDVLLLSMKHDATPDAEKGKLPYLIQQYTTGVMSSMLNNRFTEKAQEADCPFVQAQVDYGDYLISRTKDALSLTVVPKDGKVAEALKAALRELKRVKDYGFTATEYEREKSEYISRLEKIYNNREKHETNDYCRQYVDNFIENEPIPSIEDEYQIMQQMTPMLPVDMVNMVAKGLISETDTNLVVLAVLNEKEGRVYPTKTDLAEAVTGVRSEKLEAYVDNVKQEPLMTAMPKKGKIVKEKLVAGLDCKELTLSNGARVLIKKTDFNADEILMRASSEGGASLFGHEDDTNISLANYILSMSGKGNFLYTELSKALAGKQCGVNYSIADFTHGVTGKTTPKDLETMMQLLYLSYTDIKRDDKSVASLMNQLRAVLENQLKDNSTVLQDSVMATQYGHNPYYRVTTVDQLNNVSYDRVLEMARTLYGNAANFTFVFIGNYDEAVLKDLICQYVASLPAGGKKLKGTEKRTLVDGKLQNRFTRKMENPQAQAREYWRSAPMEYSLENAVMSHVAADLLNMTYNREIREKLSAAYYAGCQSAVDNDGPVTYYSVTGIGMLNPDKVTSALPEFEAGMQKALTAPDEDDLNKVKQVMLKQYDEDVKTNGYWRNILGGYGRYGKDFHTDYRKTVEQADGAKVSAFLKNVILSSGNHLEVVMQPE